MAELKLMRGGEEIALRPGVWIVGRANDASIQVPSPSVSRRHALLRVTGTRADLLDLGSQNGTFLNGAPVGGGARALHDGDRVVFGTVEFEVRRRTVTDDSALARARAAPTEPLDAGAIAAIATEDTPVPVPQRLVLAVRSGTWAAEIQRAASIHAGLVVETIAAVDIREASARPGGGVLLLELYAAGPHAFSLVRAWLDGAAGTSRAVLLSNGIEEAPGRTLAHDMGAQGYVRAGKPGILVLAAARAYLGPSAAPAEPGSHAS
jgi:pSer/pThr/pTyr-binding forkhead associated (FHA) protein